MPLCATKSTCNNNMAVKQQQIYDAVMIYNYALGGIATTTFNNPSGMQITQTTTSVSAVGLTAFRGQTTFTSVPASCSMFWHTNNVLTTLPLGFTQAFWVYVTNVSTNYTLSLAPGPATTTGKWALGLNAVSGILSFAYYNGSTSVIAAQTPVISANTWMHVAMSYNNVNGKMELFLNGVSQGSYTAPSGITTTLWNNTSSKHICGMYDIQQTYYFTNFILLPYPADTTLAANLMNRYN